MNKKYKILKRLTSIFLVLNIFLANILLNNYFLKTTFANVQSNVKDVILQSLPSSTDAYSINFSWTNPAWSNIKDTSVPNGGDNVDTPQGFKIEGLNATLKEAEFQEYANLKGDNITTGTINPILKSGSIYEFKITPYHNHTYKDANGVFYTKPAQMDKTTPLETVLFLTDINVKAAGSGNKITVTFDNPKYNNQNIFSGYRIYYQKGGSNVTVFNTYLDVSIDSPDLIETIDPTRNVSTLSYTITDNAISHGEVYAVKVEPIYNGLELRNTGLLTYKNILVNNELKKISFKTQKNKEYRTNDVHVDVPLEIKEDGKDYLKLNWWGISNTAGVVSKIEVYSGHNEQNITNKLGTIYSSDAIHINTWRIDKPIQKTYYQLKIFVDGKDSPITSSIAVFDPSIVNITPNRPNIYLETTNKDKIQINVFWDVFLRYPYNQFEEQNLTSDGKYIDLNVSYDIFITDLEQNLDKPDLPKVFENLLAKNLTQTTIKNTKNPVFNQTIEKYYTFDKNTGWTIKDIEQNKTYYVKIVATKTFDDQLGLSADPATAQIYIPTKSDISTPQTIATPPLSIKKDANNNEEITQNSITIQWKNKWFEVFDKKTNSWYSKAGVSSSGELVFGEHVTDDVREIVFFDKASEQEVLKAFLDKGIKEKLDVRLVDLTDKNIKYELLTVTIDDISSQGGYLQYIENLLKSESDDWKQVEPIKGQNNFLEHNIIDLLPNTRYAVLLRPYRILPDGKKDAYPTYVLATTLSNNQDLDVVPTIPSLFEVSKTETSIKVKWEQIAETLNYELAIDETPISDPSKAMIIKDEESINKQGENVSENNKTFIHFNIDGLFPQTGYYIWIRSKNNKISSDWSNPIYVKTDTIKTPDAPNGLGLVSQKNLDIYNSSNKTEFNPANETYLILEWAKDPKDTENIKEKQENNDVQMLLDENINGFYLAKFNNLIGNKTYFARAKTKLTVLKDKDENKKVYSYIVQLSLSENFKDVIEIEFPKYDTNGVKHLFAESPWTETYKFKTTYVYTDPGEFDGNINDKLYPLPTEDFEITYDNLTQSLNYRFRSNKLDDNMVDQRFISKLLNKNIFNFNLDLTYYYGYPIKKRTVEIPYTIFTALNERKITLSLIVDNSTFSFNPQFLNTDQIKKADINKDTSILISIEQFPTDMPILPHNQTYVSTPQKISVFVKNKNNKTQIAYTGVDMNMSLKLNNELALKNMVVFAFRNTFGTNGWQKINSNYDSSNKTFNVKSNQLGTYAIIATKNLLTTTSNNKDIVDNFNSNLQILNKNELNLHDFASSTQLNNILLAIANETQQVDLNKPISNEGANTLKRAGIFVHETNPTREASINSLVRLYEIKTKHFIQPTISINNTQFKDVKNVNPKYQKNILKAIEIGFFDENLIKPKNNITLYEVIKIVNIIIDDSGIYN